jgi:hypothetical protein
MTKYFKKVRNHENMDFMRELEKELIKERDGDVFTLTGIERGHDGEITEEELVALIEA